MYMKKSFISFVLVFSFLCGFLSAQDVISPYTRQKIEDFVTYRVILKSAEDEFTFSTIKRLEKEALAELSEHALDFEQEKCLLESLYFLEYYERALNTTGNQKELRDRMKSLMKSNVACIEKRDKSQICEWMYQLTGDVTAYYMTRSVAATFLYGMKVKGYYEKAALANKNRAISHVCLGNWCFYAPALFGGGKSRAQKHFDNAEKCVELPGEKYLVYIAQSQINFENKKKELAQSYLEKAVALDLGRRDLDLIARCNKKGYSYFQYLRDRSGIDEEMSEEEKDEEDK